MERISTAVLAVGKNFKTKWKGREWDGYRSLQGSRWYDKNPSPKEYHSFMSMLGNFLSYMRVFVGKRRNKEHIYIKHTVGMEYQLSFASSSMLELGMKNYMLYRIYYQMILSFSVCQYSLTDILLSFLSSKVERNKPKEVYFLLNLLETKKSQLKKIIG